MPESSGAQTLDDHRIMCIHVNLGWKKLNDYYTLTDRSPVHVISVVLHPRFTWRYLRKQWKKRPEWITAAEQAVKQYWLQNYADRPVCTTSTPSKLLVIDSDDDYSDEDTSIVNDEYSQWQLRARDPAVIRPLEYWSSEAMRRAFPRLSQLALDVFTIPAMSDEPERTFSSTGLMVTPCRSRLAADIIGHTQCLKSWQRQGVIDLTI